MSYLHVPHYSALSNSTGDNVAPGVGFAAAAVAVVFYGSNYVPVKQFDAQDGVAFQLFLSLGIWTVGLCVNAWRSFPQMHALVMLGGALWATGNLCVVAIIQTIGMGLGILIWGTINMLSGWASGRFGWFDIPPQVPARVVLNYIGVTLSLLASCVIFFVNPEMAQGATEGSRAVDVLDSPSDQDCSISVYDDAYPTLNTGLLPSVQDQQQQQQGSNDEQLDRKQPVWMRLTPGRRKMLGVFLAVMIGPTFGLAFVPTYYVQNHSEGASQSGLDYVFSHFSGILCAAIAYFCLYAAISRNRPAVNPRVILPAIVSGIMWGVATAAWFLANQVLSESVAFPIITTAPAVVAALWGVCVFKEIRGARNLLVLTLAFATTACGSVLNGMSR